MTWEERWHPLREEWVMIAAHRHDRPWSGSTVDKSAPAVAVVRRGLLPLPFNRVDQLLTAALAGLRPHEPTPDDETDYQNDPP